MISPTLNLTHTIASVFSCSRKDIGMNESDPDLLNEREIAQLLLRLRDAVEKAENSGDSWKIEELEREVVRLRIESEVNRWMLVIHRHAHDGFKRWPPRKREAINIAKSSALAMLEGNDKPDSVWRGFSGALNEIIKDIDDLP